MALEKLSVENFGPIKKADLELRKLTILIGEQASGKSVLAKLMASLYKKKQNNGQPTINPFLEYAITQYEPYAKYSDFPEKAANFLYCPAERLLISMISETLFNFVHYDIPLPKFLLNFGSEYEKARKNLINANFMHLGIEYSYKNEKDKVIYRQTETNLTESSSGLQSLIPMLLVIENYFILKKSSVFAIEEPELNLYPTTQRKIMEYLVEKCTKNDNRLIITTHSPYILTALSNMIEAKNIVKQNPEMHDEVAALIPPQYWLDFDDVAAYFVGSGTAYSIRDEENQNIDATPLDEVSNELGGIYDKLLDLKYATNSK